MSWNNKKASVVGLEKTRGRTIGIWGERNSGTKPNGLCSLRTLDFILNVIKKPLKGSEENILWGERQ
jgi:hypothetical protein